ncbi:substrate-binding periplasmic protein [Vibrio amylolyticus]|uniref:substrate-binding periplasmic protein n=1 Tax=Vibrio amylolyticus TaxID=2847292 RepID=UPI0035547187
MPIFPLFLISFYTQMKAKSEITTKMEKQPLIFVGLILLLLLPTPLYAQYKLHFFVPDFPPYTMVDGVGVPVGIGIDKMELVLSKMDVEYSIEVGSNHGRALKELRKGRSDGFFLASRNEERDEFALFSEPVMVNRWVWVFRNENSNATLPIDPDFKDSAKVKSLLNTNTQYWLVQNEYNVQSPASNIQALVSSLDNKEVDAIFVAEVVFKHYIKNAENYTVMLGKEKDFGVYISRDFIQENPLFMFELNAAIRETSEQ